MTAFGSYCERNEPATLNAFVIAGANSMFSFISGFAVFASLGHLAHLEGVAVTDLDFAGFSLVFGTWPVVMGTLPGGEHWVRLLFFDLFLLGIDSGFGLLEGSLTAAADTVYFSKWSKSKLAAVQCTIGFGFSFIYCTDAGLNFLDAVDFYINFVMLLVGFFETFAAGWIYGLEDQIEKLGPKIVLAYFFANFGSVIIACILWFGIAHNSVRNTMSAFVSDKKFMSRSNTLSLDSTDCHYFGLRRPSWCLRLWHRRDGVLHEAEDGRRARQVDLELHHLGSVLCQRHAPPRPPLPFHRLSSRNLGLHDEAVHSARHFDSFRQPGRLPDGRR